MLGRASTVAVVAADNEGYYRGEAVLNAAFALSTGRIGQTIIGACFARAALVPGRPQVGYSCESRGVPCAVSVFPPLRRCHFWPEWWHMMTASVSAARVDAGGQISCGERATASTHGD